MIKFNKPILVKCEECGNNYHVSYEDLSYNLYVDESTDCPKREHFFSGDINCPHCPHCNDLGISIFESTGFTIDCIRKSINIVEQPDVDIVIEDDEESDMQLITPIEYLL